MKKTTILATSLVLALSLFGGSLDLQAAEKDKKKRNGVDTYQLLNLFGDVFERVRASYVTEVSDEELIEAAITGMLTSLDPHSSYLNAKSFKDMRVQTRGKFGGLGIEVTMENGLIKVVSPIDDTPAHRAGLKSGDFITHLNGERVLGLTLSQAVEKMRGKVGEDIKLTIRRVGKEAFDVTVTRGIIPIRTVRSRVEGGDIGYVRISSFSQPTDKGLKKAMAKIKKELGDKFGGLVLDLRNNPGGLLDQAIAVSDAFMEKGEIVSTRSRNKDEHQRFNARPGDLTDGKPIVVLINGGSASASEIVAGALQDHKRAIILGTKSFGKGSVQTIIPLQQHGAMRLTTARYYTPSGRSIQEIGVTPDIIVEPARIEAVEPRRRTREGDLRGALKNDNGKNHVDDKEKSDKNSKDGDKKSPKSAEKKAAPDRQDFQLQRALDLLRGVSLFSQRIKG
ncbi:MAG: S41 family peptidase [Rhodospirillaceae bacterium]|jgi:carboxyl-terminal processing protease|nr:S41 family peptidase [Rhodospirillaceae bacterium]MBT4940162.1 S41 family peptidase [Rhodospirillaceae bacterium]MBT5938792.1 S41 family peptidase [Rhodospirillaceae bacterium]MBT7266472.1 S41 family peptidase [Rhodospirillaceae bacterium]